MPIAVNVEGNLTRDPELQFSASGLAVCKFAVAVNNGKRNEKGEWEDGEPDFLDVVCFRSLAENVAESIAKGDRVVVVGRVKQSRWETEDGQKRSRHECIAEAVGPSLRFATVAITRNEKRSDAGGFKADDYDANGKEPF